MAITLGAILALLSVAVAVYPFLQRRFFGTSASEMRDAFSEEVGREGGVEGGAKTPEPSDGLQSIYDAIRTLQLERELGNIPEGLYREQLNGYRMQAALVLRERDAFRSGNPDPSLPDPSLEEEIKLARAGLYSPSGGGFACTNCARPIPAGNENCPECGVAAPKQTGDSAP